MTLAKIDKETSESQSAVKSQLTFWCCFNQHGNRFDLRATSRTEIDSLYRYYNFEYEYGQGTYASPVEVAISVNSAICSSVDDIQGCVERGEIFYNISNRVEK
jgi:hypothetical protein